MQLDPVKDEQLSLDGTAITEDGKLFLLQLKNEYKSAIWDTDSGRLVHRLDGGSRGRSLMAAISSKSMRAVISQSNGCGLQVFDIQNGELLHKLLAARIEKIFLIRDGTIAITTNSEWPQPTSFEAWDLITGKKLATFTVDTNPKNPFAMCPLSDTISFVAPASATVISLGLHIPGVKKTTLGPSWYGAHKELTEFKGILGPCDPNDVDNDEDDDETDVRY